MNKRLSDILAYSINNIPYYRKHINEYNEKIEFGSIPFIDKDIVIQNYSEFLSVFAKEGVNVSKINTSGSSGKILPVYWDKPGETYSLLCLWNNRKKNGVRPNSKFCYFGSTHIDDDDNVVIRKIIVNKMKTCMIFNKMYLSEEHLDAYYKNMVEFEPEWLMAPSSVLLVFGQYIKNNMLELPKSIKFIESTGELLTENVQNKIQDIFGINVVNHYGLTEFYGVAYGCENNRLHIISDNVYIEVIKDNQPVYDQEGEICITGLHNRAMPLLRYKTGDRGILRLNEKCTCGNENKILEISVGRLNDSFMYHDRIIDSSCFYFIVQRINKKYHNVIVNFQVVKDNDFLFFYFVLNQMNTDIKIFEDAICQDFKYLDFYLPFKIIVCENIYPHCTSGKHKFFINNDEAKTNI